MTDKNIIAALVARLRCYTHMWNDEDHKAVEEAVARLRTADTAGWSPNAGGVCDNCGEPGFVHSDYGDCPSDEVCQQRHRELDRWHATVRPASEAYRKARRWAKDVRRRRRKGISTPEDQEQADHDADVKWGMYQAAIRRADREAGEEDPAEAD